MACSFDKGLLSALIDGELSEREKGLVQTHASACVECRREIDDARRASNLLHQVAPVRAPESILRVVEREIVRQPPARESFFARYRVALEGSLALAVGLLIVLSIVAIVDRPLQTPAPTAASAPRRLDPKAADETAGGRRRIEQGNELTDQKEGKLFKQENLERAQDRGLQQSDKGPGHGARDGSRQEPAKPAAPSEPELRPAPPAPESANAKPETQFKAKSDAAPLAGNKPAESPTATAAPAAPKAPAPRAEEAAKPPPAPAARLAADDLKKKETDTVELGLIVYADRLTDGRDAIRTECGKWTQDVTIQDACFTATLDADTAPKLQNALKNQKRLTVVALAPETRSTWDEIAGYSQRGWNNQTLASAKESLREKGIEADKLQPEKNRAESQLARGDARKMAQAQQAKDAPQGAAAAKSLEEEKKSVIDKLSEGRSAGKGQPSKEAPAPVIVRIYLLPPEEAGNVADSFRRNAELKRVAPPAKK